MERTQAIQTLSGCNQGSSEIGRALCQGFAKPEATVIVGLQALLMLVATVIVGAQQVAAGTRHIAAGCELEAANK